MNTFIMALNKSKFKLPLKTAIKKSVVNLISI